MRQKKWARHFSFHCSVAERVTTGYYLDFEIKRNAIDRYGLTISDVQEIIQSAIGGMGLTVSVEGRADTPSMSVMRGN